MELYNIGGININILRYADVIALLTKSEEQLQSIVNEVNSKSETCGLRTNMKKTKVMVVRRSHEERTCIIFISCKKLEQVIQIIGTERITEDGRCEEEIRSRIEIARGNFTKMKDVLASKKFKLARRKRLLKCYVLSTLLYASEILSCKNYIDLHSGFGFFFFACSFCGLFFLSLKLVVDVVVKMDYR